jgi:hypothetical protein
MAFTTAHPVSTTPQWSRRFKPTWVFYIADNEPESVVFRPAVSRA